MTKKTRQQIFYPILIIVVLYGLSYLWKAFPLISGYGAKDLCSCAFIGKRDSKEIKQLELGEFPFNIGNYSIDLRDSSATGHVLGFARRKAIFRKGFGCTLLNGMTESEFRQQKITGPTPLAFNDSMPWPVGNLTNNDSVPGLNLERLNEAVDFAFEEPDGEKKRNTRAILVIYNDQIIAEKYANGYDPKSPHTGWSMTKSVTNALFGILVKENKIDVNATTGFPEWKGTNQEKITIDQLLHANSGLRWDETYTGPSDVTNMLYNEGNMAAFAKKLPSKDSPGTVFHYSSGTTNMLSWIIRSKLDSPYYYSFPSEKLFYKIGMNSALIEPDASGTFVGSSYCFANARDWARFGLLYLHDGIWNGERILPEGWVKYSTKPSKGALKGEYGAQFWLNVGAPGNSLNRIYPNVPTDCFYADGYEGQNVWIIPSKNLVVVRLSVQHGNNLDEDRFLEKVISALPSGKF